MIEIFQSGQIPDLYDLYDLYDLAHVLPGGSRTICMVQHMFPELDLYVTIRSCTTYNSNRLGSTFTVDHDLSDM